MRAAHFNAFGLALGLVAMATTWFGAGAAKAAVLHNCGHTIVTSYDEGWVLIDSMDGIDDPNKYIYVEGIVRGANDEWIYVDEVEIHYAMWMEWGYNRSQVKIAGYSECVATLN
jgi:hypothetical protein